MELSTLDKIAWLVEHSNDPQILRVIRSYDANWHGKGFLTAKQCKRIDLMYAQRLQSAVTSRIRDKESTAVGIDSLMDVERA